MFQSELMRFAREVLCAVCTSRERTKGVINFISPLVLSENSDIFWPQTNTSHLIPSVQPNRPKRECKFYHGTSLPHLSCAGFSATKNGLKTTNHSPVAWPIELQWRETNTGQHLFLLSDELYSCVWSCLLD